jgi:hypothetical protein
MTRRTHVALLATLMSTAAWGQEVSVFGTTMAQMWKSEAAGFDKATYTPATQYLGIDATRLGSDNLSLHLFGWGRTDLKESTSFDGTKSGGYLNYGYLQYRFDKANAEIKAGRFTAQQATGYEQVDGVAIRTDLRGGFTFSAFGGKPVLYKTVDPREQTNYDYQRDFIVGARVGYRMQKLGEIGLSYLQDGSKAAKDISTPMPVDYTRKQAGLDLMIAPFSFFNLQGRTLFDMGDHDTPAPLGSGHTRVAEHDYKATIRLSSTVSFSATMAERNFHAYYAGTNLPSLFRQDEKGWFKGWGGSLQWLTTENCQITLDYRHMHRQNVSDVNRGGGEIRWALNERKLQLGVNAHWVNATRVYFVDPLAPYRSLNHAEMRAWIMTVKGKFTASFDTIFQRFQKDNPYLDGLRNVVESVASLGYAVNENLKVSGDLSYGRNVAASNETRGLLRAEYRFGFAKKGGR